MNFHAEIAAVGYKRPSLLIVARRLGEHGRVGMRELGQDGFRNVSEVDHPAWAAVVLTAQELMRCVNLVGCISVPHLSHQHRMRRVHHFVHGTPHVDLWTGEALMKEPHLGAVDSCRKVQYGPIPWQIR